MFNATRRQIELIKPGKLLNEWRPFRWAVEIAMAAALVNETASLIFMTEPAQKEIEPTPIYKDRTFVEHKPDLIALTSFDPFFRQFSRTPQQTHKKKSKVPKIKLYGTRVLQGTTGTAIVSIDESAQKLVKNGEELAPQILLRAVYPDKIGIDTGSAISFVHFANVIHNKLNSSNILQEAEIPRRYKNGVFSSPNEVEKIFSDVSLTSFRDDERGQGLEVLGAGDFDNLDKLGIKQGDFLFGTNGLELKSVRTLKQLAHSYDPRLGFNLVVVRPPNSETFVLSLN